MIAIFLQNLGLVEAQTTDGRLLQLSWMLFSLFLSLSYTVLLLSFMTLPTREIGIRTISALANAVSEGRYKAVTMKGSSIAFTLAESGIRRDEIIGNEILKNSWFVEPQKMDLVNFINKNTDKIAFITSERHIQLHYQDSFYISKDSFFIVPAAIAMVRGFPLRHEINRLILKGAASGVFDKTYNDYIFQKKLRRTNQDYDQIYDKQLKMEDFYEVFLFLVFGNILAGIVCFFEQIIYAKKQKRRENKLKQVSKKLKKKKMFLILPKT